MSSSMLVIHSLLSIFYGYSIYIYVYDIHPPKEIIKIRDTNYGPFKYLTFWDLLLQFVFFTLSAISDVTSSQRRRGKPALQRLLDFLFATVVFSAAAFVSTSFWAIYSIDRNLIFPAIYDSFFPSWLNHAVHTLPSIAVLLELFCTCHTFPSQRRGFLTVAVFALIYLIWVCYIAHTTGHWVYPVLAQLSAVGRSGFIAAMCVLIGIFYIMGHGLQALRWGHEDSFQDLIYHKKK